MLTAGLVADKIHLPCPVHTGRHPSSLLAAGRLTVSFILCIAPREDLPRPAMSGGHRRPCRDLTQHLLFHLLEQRAAVDSNCDTCFVRSSSVALKVCSTQRQLHEVLRIATS